MVPEQGLSAGLGSGGLGVWNLVDLAVLAANTYQQAQDLENFAWAKYVQMVYIPTMIPHVLLILVSVILVFRGRQLAGRLRWYYLGWLLVLMGLLNMRLPLPAPLRSGVFPLRCWCIWRSMGRRICGNLWR